MFTLEQLQMYDGVRHPKIHTAINGIVWDMTYKGQNYYAPGRSYAKMAGKDSTMSLARMSLQDSNFKKMNMKIHEWSDEGKKSIKSWLEFFSDKYTVVGQLRDAIQPVPVKWYG